MELNKVAPKPDVFLLTEVWGPVAMTLEAIRKMGYDVHLGLRSSGDCRGGVAVLVRREAYASATVTTLPGAPAGMEMVVVDLASTTSGIITRVASVYVTPDRNNALEVTTLLDGNCKDVDVVGGDFNARHPAWCPRHSVACSQAHARGNAIHQWVVDHNWSLANSGRPNLATNVEGTSCVDLFLLHPRMRGTISAIVPATDASLSDHLMVLLPGESVHFRPTKRRSPPVVWSKVTPEFWRAATAVIASTQRRCGSIDAALAWVSSNLPRADITPDEGRAPGTDPFQYLRDLASEQTCDAAAWRMLKASDDAPPPRTPLREPASGTYTLRTPRARARAFARLFATKHSSTIRGPSRPLPSASDTVVAVTEAEVHFALKRMNRTGAQDPRDIPPIVLWHLRAALAPALAEALTFMLRSGENLPDTWRFSFLIPLLKDGKDATLINSYRPVAITSILSRVCERVIAQRVIEVTARKLSGAQFGFTKQRSTVDALGVLLDSALQGFETKQKPTHRVLGTNSHSYSERSLETMLGLIDLTDAFSKVPVSQLLDAMEKLDTPPELLRFVQQWLHDRSAVVFSEGVRSDCVALTAGVPQGSVLGPLLFVLYIDGLLRALENAIPRLQVGRPGITMSIAAYADDITLSVTGVDSDKVSDVMSMWCKTLSRWCAANGMIISGKTSFMIFTHGSKRHLTENRVSAFCPVSTDFHGIKIGETDFAPSFEPHALLGVTLDTQLHFKAHALEAAAKAAKDVLRLARIAPFTHPALMRSIWSATAQKMLYGSQIWAYRMRPSGWDAMEVQHRAGCRTLLRAVATANGHSAVAEAGFWPIREMAFVRNIRWAYKTSTYNATHPVISDRFGLKIEDAHSVRPWINASFPPETPPPTNVHFLIDPTPGVTRKMPPSVRLCANMQMRSRVDALLGSGPRFTGLCDGSVAERPDAGATPVPPARTASIGGAAAILQLPNSSLWEKFRGPTSMDPCSYVAEVEAAELLLEAMTVSIREWRELNSAAAPPNAVIMTDSRSWLAHAAAGPLDDGVFTRRLWTSLASVAAQVQTLACAFIFSHCGDPDGDIVDAEADLARTTVGNVPINIWWHEDLARVVLQQTAAARASAFREKQSFRTKHCLTAVGRPPPLALARSDAYDLCRLRTGAWAKLGWGTIGHDVPNDPTRRVIPQPCPFCGALLIRHQGMAIEHIFECAHSTPSSARPPWMTVKSMWAEQENVPRLAAIVAYARLFEVRPPAIPAPTTPV